MCPANLGDGWARASYAAQQVQDGVAGFFIIILVYPVFLRTVICCHCKYLLFNKHEKKNFNKKVQEVP